VLVLELGQARLGGGDLQLALAHVVQVLRRTHDQVDDRAYEREQRGRRGTGDQHGIGDPPARVAVGPVDQRDPDNDEKQQEQVDGQGQPAVFNPEQGNEAHLNARVYWRRLQKEPSEGVPDAEEDQNHRGHDHGHQADHRAEARSVAVHRP
jgi:hypothetical protein